MFRLNRKRCGASHNSESSLEDLDCEFGKEMIEAIKSLACEFGKNIIPAFVERALSELKTIDFIFKMRDKLSMRAYSGTQ